MSTFLVTTTFKLKWKLIVFFLIFIFICSVLFGFHFTANKYLNNTSIANLALIIHDDDASECRDCFDMDDYNIYNSMSRGETLVIELDFFPFQVVEVMSQDYPTQESSLLIMPIAFFDFWGFKNMSDSFTNYITDDVTLFYYYSKFIPWRNWQLFFLGIKILEGHNFPPPSKINLPEIIF